MITQNKPEPINWRKYLPGKIVPVQTDDLFIIAIATKDAKCHGQFRCPVRLNIRLRCMMESSLQRNDDAIARRRRPLAGHTRRDISKTLRTPLRKDYYGRRDSDYKAVVPAQRLYPHGIGRKSTSEHRPCSLIPTAVNLLAADEHATNVSHQRVFRSHCEKALFSRLPYNIGT